MNVHRVANIKIGENTISKSCDVLIFEKGLRIASPPHFVYGLLRKIFFLYYILLIGQFSLSDCFYIWTYGTTFLLQMF